MWKNGMALFGRLRHVALLEDISHACFMSTLEIVVRLRVVGGVVTVFAQHL